LSLEKELKILAVGNPFQFLGGGHRRTYEVLKHYSELGADVALYIPLSQLIATRALQIFFHISEDDPYRNIDNLEKSGIYIHENISAYMEKIDKQVIKHFNTLRKGGMFWIINNFRKLIPLSNKDAITSVKTFLESVKISTKNTSKMHAVYVMDNHLDMIQAGQFISQSIKAPLFILLQSIPIISLKSFVSNEWIYNVSLSGKSSLRTLFRIIIRILEQSYLKHKTLLIYDDASKTLAALFSVSEAPLKLSNLDTWASNKGISTQVLIPGNAISQDIEKYYREREKILQEKENYAIFYARLGVGKGILEIPFIAKKLEKAGYKLILAGKFESADVKARFERICRRLCVRNIEYMGYLPDRKLWETIAKSKVLVYPSHDDTFSLVVLESLFLGNSIVAYNIPAIVSIYKNLPVVRIVEEYNYKGMAEEAVKILKMDMREFAEEHQNENLIRFLKLHSSWKNVARAEIQSICNIIRNKLVRDKRIL
jgi:glycosyltransferase involved in cell wall biosynthesis